MSRSTLEKLLRRGTLWERLDGWLRRLGCRLFGHRQPYIEKLSARLCQRCYLVIEARSPYLLGLPLPTPWSAADKPAGAPGRARKPENS